MYQHILIATDGSELSERAAREAIDLASCMKARVTLFTSSIPFGAFAPNSMSSTDTPQKYEGYVEQRALSRLKPGEDYARTKGVAAATIHAYAEHPFEAIIDAATRADCDLICMASHGRKGVAGLVIGSETHKVLTHSKVPVLVCR